METQGAFSRPRPRPSEDPQDPGSRIPRHPPLPDFLSARHEPQEVAEVDGHLN